MRLRLQKLEIAPYIMIVPLNEQPIFLHARVGLVTPIVTALFLWKLL